MSTCIASSTQLPQSNMIHNTNDRPSNNKLEPSLSGRKVYVIDLVEALDKLNL